MTDENGEEFKTAGEMNAGPEHTTKHKLTKWLKDCGAGVFWEEKNKWDYPTFSIERNDSSTGIPDLLVLIGGNTFVIEYKTGSSVSQLYDAHTQIRGYWREYITNDMAYQTGDVTHSVDGFLTASQHSKKGRLFPRYSETRQDYYDMDSTRQSCYEWGQLPPAEFRMTEQHIRLLWRDVKEIAGHEKATAKQTPSIGALLSDVLIQPTDSPNPAVLWNEGTQNQNWEVFDE